MEEKNSQPPTLVVLNPDDNMDSSQPSINLSIPEQLRPTVIWYLPNCSVTSEPEVSTSWNQEPLVINQNPAIRVTLKKDTTAAGTKPTTTVMLNANDVPSSPETSIKKVESTSEHHGMITRSKYKQNEKDLKEEEERDREVYLPEIQQEILDKVFYGEPPTGSYEEEINAIIRDITEGGNNTGTTEKETTGAEPESTPTDEEGTLASQFILDFGSMRMSTLIRRVRFNPYAKNTSEELQRSLISRRLNYLEKSKLIALSPYKHLILRVCHKGVIYTGPTGEICAKCNSRFQRKISVIERRFVHENVGRKRAQGQACCNCLKFLTNYQETVNCLKCTKKLLILTQNTESLPEVIPVN